MNKRTAHITATIVLVLMTLVAFRPVLSNGFVSWGDRADIVNNPHFRGFAPGNIVWMFTTIQMGHYQPLSWLSYAVDYSLWQMDPRGYHLTSLLLHTACAVAVYFLIIELLKLAVVSVRDSTQRLIPWAALIGALLWAVHPLRVETVAWATERRGSLSGLFLILSTLLYLKHARGRSAPPVSLDGLLDSTSRRYWWAVALFGLSLLSKEFGITLPAILLVLDAYPLRRYRGENIGRQFIGFAWEKLPFIILAAAGAAIALASSAQSGVAKSVADYSIFQRFAQCFYGLAFYLWKSIAPFDLSPLYAIPRNLDPFAAVYVACATGIIGLTFVLIALRKRLPSLLAAWVCFVIVLSPVLGLVQTGRQMAADRYTYLPSIALCAIISGFALRVMSNGRALGAKRAAMAVVALIAVAILMAGTWQYCRVWRNSLTLWQHAVMVNPSSVAALNNLGVALIEDDQLAEAKTVLERALSLEEASIDAHNNLGVALAAQGRIGEAIEHWQQVLELDPDNSDASANLDFARAQPAGQDVRN